jgi:hypothetical protein
MKTSITKNEQGDYTLTIADNEIVAMKTREHAEQVRQVCLRNVALLPEFTRADLLEFAGIDKRETASGELHRRLGLTWKPGQEDYWHGAVVPAYRRNPTVEMS